MNRKADIRYLRNIRTLGTIKELLNKNILLPEEYELLAEGLRKIASNEYEDKE